MRLIQAVRTLAFRCVGVNLYNHVSLDFSMKPLPQHKVLSVFSSARDICIPRIFSPYPLTVRFPTRQTFEVRGVTVAGMEGLVFSNGALLAESSSWPPEIALSGSPIIRRRGKALPGQYIVIGNASYYHFLIENFGQALALITEFPNAKILVPEELESFAKQALGLLPKSTEVVSYRKRVQPERVILTSRFLTLGRPQPREIEAIRNFAASVMKSTRKRPDIGEKIYVSRRLASRSPRGEQDLERFLESAGFRIVVAEHLPLQDQIEIFSTASVILGPHGAGLSNIVFGKPGATVIELLDRKWPNHCFEILAAECLLDFHRIIVPNGDATSEGLIERVENLLRDLGIIDPLESP